MGTDTLPLFSVNIKFPTVSQLNRVVEDAERKRLKNRVAHSAPGSVVIKPQRKKRIVGQVE